MKNVVFSLIIGISLLTFNSSDLYSNTNNNDTIVLTLDDAIKLASDSSLNAFIQENLYLAAYWRYNSYRAQRLPFMTLNTSPAEYNRTLSQEYDSQENRYRYVERQTFYSSANLSINQNLTPTGGSLFLDSDISRLENFGDLSNIEFNTVPLRLGLRQPLFAHNEFKWQKKIEPLKYEKAKLEFIEGMEEIALETVAKFFELALAKVNLEIAKTQKANAEKLLNMGKRRFDIASISREDLYMLELDKVNTENELQRAKLNYKRAQMNFNSFLRLDANTNVEIILPEDIPELYVDISESLALAKKHHPEIKSIRETILESKRDVEKTKRESRFNANLEMSFGLNQMGEKIINAYQDPLDQQIVKLGVSVPLIDWGTAKGRHNLAKHNHQVILTYADQSKIDFEQNVILTTEEFNNQSRFVKGTNVADSIAKEAYELAFQRFVSGQIDILRLNSSQQSRVSARMTYINALHDYWYYFYKVRKLTLHDFLNNNSLTDEFDEKFEVLP